MWHLWPAKRNRKKKSGNSIASLYFPCRCNWGIEKRPGFGEEGDMKRRSPQAIWPASSGGYPATLQVSELKLGVRAVPARIKGRTFKGAGGTRNGGKAPGAPLVRPGQPQARSQAGLPLQ